MVYIAVDYHQIFFYLGVFSVSLFWGLLLFHRAQTKLVLPTIEVSDSHMVVNTLMSKREVYNLDCVSGAKFVLHLLYFRHNGWPVLVPLPRMPKNRREELLNVIKGI